MASPFTLFGMARRATQQFRQMSYGPTDAPNSAPRTPAASEDNSDTVSIISQQRRRSSPLVPTRKATIAAVVDNVTVTSSPPSSPPAKSILSDVASNGSSTTLAQEPSSMLFESPKMDAVDLKSPGDYFSLRKSSGSRDSADSDGADKGSLEEQIRGLMAEKERLSAELRTVSEDKDLIAGEFKGTKASNNRLEKELKERQDQWDAERAQLADARVEDQRRFETEKASLMEKLDKLTAENTRLADDVERSTKDREAEREMLAEMVKEAESSEREKAQLKERVIALESSVSEKVQECNRLTEAVTVLKREKVDSGRTIGALQQYLSVAKDELKAMQAQSTKELEGARLETQRILKEVKGERESWEAKRVRWEAERAEERSRFERERYTLHDRLSGLEKDVVGRERALKRLEEETSVVKRENEEGRGVIVTLQQQLGSAKDGMKKLQDSAVARTTALQRDLDRLRDERDREVASKEGRILSLSSSLEGMKEELAQARSTMQKISNQRDATIHQLSTNLVERNRVIDEVEKEKVSLGEQLAALGDSLEEKEREKRSIEEEIVVLTKEKDLRGQTVASLQEQLTLAAEEMKLLRDTSTAKTAGLEEELRRLREERDQGSCWIM